MPAFPVISVPDFKIIRFIGVTLLSLFMISLVLYFLPTERSFVISTKTLGFEIVTVGESANSWQLPSGTLCLREQKLDLLSKDYLNQPLCVKRQISNAEFSWSEGARLKITKSYDENSSLKIQLVSHESDEVKINDFALTKYSFIELSNEEWTKSGSLIFNGYIIFGNEPSPGSRDHILSGNYSIYEKLLLRDGPLLVDSGAFNTGDEIKVLSNFDDKPLIMNGFISANDHGMNIISYSPSSNSYIEVKRLGSERSIVSSSWYKRALNDPFLIALTALLAILVGFIELINFARSKD